MAFDSISDLPGKPEENKPTDPNPIPAGSTGRGKGRGGRPEFDNSLGELSRRKVARVSGKGQHRTSGRYVQLNFRLPEEYVDLINEIAAELGVTKEAAKRWLIGIALDAWLSGVRPEFSTEVTRNIILPDLPDS